MNSIKTHLYYAVRRDIMMNNTLNNMKDTTLNSWACHVIETGKGDKTQTNKKSLTPDDFENSTQSVRQCNKDSLANSFRNMQYVYTKIIHCNKLNQHAL